MAGENGKGIREMLVDMLMVEHYETHKGQIMVEHENGYYGCLYGESSMSIFYGNREVFHTGHRNKNIKTVDDLYKKLADMPQLMELFGKGESTS